MGASGAKSVLADTGPATGASVKVCYSHKGARADLPGRAPPAEAHRAPCCVSSRLGSPLCDLRRISPVADKTFVKRLYDALAVDDRSLWVDWEVSRASDARACPRARTLGCTVLRCHARRPAMRKPAGLASRLTLRAPRRTRHRARTGRMRSSRALSSRTPLSSCSAPTSSILRYANAALSRT
jgi:hypothetical protein